MMQTMDATPEVDIEVIDSWHEKKKEQFHSTRADELRVRTEGPGVGHAADGHRQTHEATGYRQTHVATPAQQPVVQQPTSVQQVRQANQHLRYVPIDPSQVPMAQSWGGKARKIAELIKAQRWPPWTREAPDFKLYIVGTWNNWKPEEMIWWQKMAFATSGNVVLGDKGTESFQLLLDGEWHHAIYPHVEDANPWEDHTVLGPDGRGEGKNWTIGSNLQDRAYPGAQYRIAAVPDAIGNIRLVSWKPQ